VYSNFCKIPLPALHFKETEESINDDQEFEKKERRFRKNDTGHPSPHQKATKPTSRKTTLKEMTRRNDDLRNKPEERRSE
jgi:hypothetical protein